MSKKIEVTFHPQVWINDYCYDADPQGDVKFMVDKSDLVGKIIDDYSSDELQDHPNCPKWIKDWSGPFYFDWDE